MPAGQSYGIMAVRDGKAPVWFVPWLLVPAGLWGVGPPRGGGITLCAHCTGCSESAAGVYVLFVFLVWSRLVTLPTARPLCHDLQGPWRPQWSSESSRADMCMCVCASGCPLRDDTPHLLGALSSYLEFWKQLPGEVPWKGQAMSSQELHLWFSLSFSSSRRCKLFLQYIFHPAPSVEFTETLLFSEVPDSCPGKQGLSKLLSFLWIKKNWTWVLKPSSWKT